MLVQEDAEITENWIIKKNKIQFFLYFWFIYYFNNMQEQPELKTHAKAHVELRHLKIPVLPSPITALAVRVDLVLVGKENGFIEILQYPTFIKIG